MHHISMIYDKREIKLKFRVSWPSKWLWKNKNKLLISNYKKKFKKYYKIHIEKFTVVSI